MKKAMASIIMLVVCGCKPEIVASRVEQTPRGLHADIIGRIARISLTDNDARRLLAGVMDDICALSNRTEQVELISTAARKVSEGVRDDADLGVLARRLTFCADLTEMLCDGCRRMDISETAWDLRIGVLARYVSVTNECTRNVARYERRFREVTNQSERGMSSGSNPAGWIVGMAKALDGYANRLGGVPYRMETQNWTEERRARLRARIEQAAGRKIRFIEPESPPTHEHTNAPTSF